MAVLLLFNTNDSISMRDIGEHTQLPEKELIKHVQTLLDAKILVTEVRRNIKDITRR